MRYFLFLLLILGLASCAAEHRSEAVTTERSNLAATAPPEHRALMAATNNLINEMVRRGITGEDVKAAKQAIEAGDIESAYALMGMTESEARALAEPLMAATIEANAEPLAELEYVRDTVMQRLLDRRVTKAEVERLVAANSAEEAAWVLGMPKSEYDALVDTMQRATLPYIPQDPGELAKIREAGEKAYRAGLEKLDDAHRVGPRTDSARRRNCEKIAYSLCLMQVGLAGAYAVSAWPVIFAVGGLYCGCQHCEGGLWDWC